MNIGTAVSYNDGSDTIALVSKVHNPSMVDLIVFASGDGQSSKEISVPKRGSEDAAKDGAGRTWKPIS